jgi:hypothetical protein
MVIGGFKNLKVVNIVNDEYAKMIKTPTSTYGHLHPRWPSFLNGLTLKTLIAISLCNI